LVAFDNQFVTVDSLQRVGARTFFRRRDAGSDNFDLVVRDRSGTRKLIDIAAIRKADGGAPYALNYFLAAPDGAKVAVGISKAGTEDAILRVYDVRTGQVLGASVERAQFGLLSWSDDSSTLYVNQLRKLSSEDSPLVRYEKSAVARWSAHANTSTAFSHAPLEAAGLPATETPQIVMSPTTPFAALRLQNGADPNIAVWITAKAQENVETSWRPLVSHKDGVTAFELSGNNVFLLSSADAPTFKVIRLVAGENLARGRVVLAPDADRVIDSIHAAADGLYVVARRGIYAELLRVQADGSSEKIRLPSRGRIDEASSDPREPGITLSFENWNLPPRVYAYDPHARVFADLRLTVAPTMAPEIRVGDLYAKALDGVSVPLTVLSATDQPSKGPMIVRVYGSYGISILPSFHVQAAAFIREGGSYAVCHVRGGGELGDAWRLAGKDANKPNTWRDLIACGQELIRRGLTDRSRLFIYGGSGGGIAVGRAATEQPDLFAGVIAAVPPPNMLRLEAMPGGALETQEFGSIKTESGFRNLLMMDTYQHVSEGVSYPPFLITMGLNDARIAPWQPAKLAARLIATGNTSVLLRVDLDNGHGIGSTRAQIDSLYADIFAFAFWHSGRPGWSPRISSAEVSWTQRLSFN
jgi:prolyl oligopeptidase